VPDKYYPGLKSERDDGCQSPESRICSEHLCLIPACWNMRYDPLFSATPFNSVLRVCTLIFLHMYYSLRQVQYSSMEAPELNSHKSTLCRKLDTTAGGC